MLKKIMRALLALAMLAALGGCAGEEAGGVPVQRADSLLTAAGAGDRYAAMVVSEDVTNIKRDYGKSIAELYVAVGDAVKAGDKLFSYDLEALELEKEKQQLELEKMKNEQTGYSEQLTKLEQQLGYTYNEADKSRLTLEINTLKTTILENDYQMIAKENSIADLEQTLANVDVLSPVDGTVRSVNEEEGAESYISIQQEGAYRVKGSLNEMSMYSGGLMPGVRVRAYSRVESGVYWEGTVLSIDTDNPTQNEQDYWYGGDPMSSSSGYAFYVELDSVEGLLLGQHVYVELAPAAEKEGLWIPEGFLTNYGMDEATGEMTAQVWAESDGKLTLRSVTLGMYDGMDFSYEIVSGLEAGDYVADPMDPDCAEGAAVSRRAAEDFSGEAEG